MLTKAFGALFLGCLAVASARAQGYVEGMDFVVTHPTTIIQIGAYDGGAAFTSDESVGIFDAVTGDLIGPELQFGPGAAGKQIGDSFYESVTPFVLGPGEYAVISSGASGPVGDGSIGLSGVNSYLNLGGTLDLPGGNRFNAGSLEDISPITVVPSSVGAFDLVDPVPDGGATVAWLGGALMGLAWLRRKL